MKAVKWLICLFLVGFCSSVMAQGKKTLEPWLKQVWQPKVLKGEQDFDEGYSAGNCAVLVRQDRKGVQLNASEKLGRVVYYTTVDIQEGAKTKIAGGSWMPAPYNRGILLGVVGDSKRDVFALRCATKAQDLPLEVKRLFNGYAGIK